MVLPFIRISPDHGPNSKMLGKNKSDPSSFFYAMKFIEKFKMKMKPKKSLGQNFLKDKNILSKIVNNGKISKKDIILEIGPGTGNLTRKNN